MLSDFPEGIQKGLTVEEGEGIWPHMYIDGTCPKFLTNESVGRKSEWKLTIKVDQYSLMVTIYSLISVIDEV